MAKIVKDTELENLLNNESAQNTETKEEKFKRLAAVRVSNVLDDLESLSKLASPAVYGYTPAEIETMFSAIEAAAKESIQKFLNPAAGTKKKFSF